MARNKYPEETMKLILDVSAGLFSEKGYDNTSLQDIINETKLSKGAIYHHFDSKEDILKAIFHRLGNENAEIFAEIRDDHNLNAIEKLRKIFQTAVLHSNQSVLLTVSPCLLNNPLLSGNADRTDIRLCSSAFRRTDLDGRYEGWFD